MIQVKSLTKRFGKVAAVDAVTFDVEQGRALALWGTNGAGKTTIIRCVLGLIPFEGEITVCGIDVRRRGKEARALIGYVPQELGFYDDLGVDEAVAFFARLKGLRTPRLSGCLEPVGLAGHSRKRIRELSGGMKQRLALALALLGDPPVLVLDELTASLDAAGRAEFVRTLGSLGDRGRTMLFASHRTEEIRELADAVLTLDGGRVVSEQSPEHAGEPDINALRLIVPTMQKVHAESLLRDAGFDAHANGVGLIVRVDRGRKAEPFAILAAAQMPVSDFEIVRPAKTGEEKS